MKKSQLHKIKETGFKTPDAYFDTFDQRLLDKMAVQKEMASITDAGYKVPDTYFENFDAKLEARLKYEASQEDHIKVIPMPFWRNAGLISGVAAALILMFTILQKSDTPLSINQVETASLEAYLNDENLNIYDIASLLDEEDLVLDNFVSTSFTEESLENYLLNNTSIEDLIFGK